jgi:hypothetical protein
VSTGLAKAKIKNTKNQFLNSLEYMKPFTGNKYRFPDEYIDLVIFSSTI